MDEVVEVKSLLLSAPELGYEVLPGVSRRRVWGMEEKLRILAQSVAPGSSPKLTCRMHGVSSGQFYTWRKQFRTGELTGFMPVSIAPEPPALPAMTQADIPGVLPAAPAAGNFEVELLSGVKLRFTGAVDAVTLRLILSALS